MTNDRTEEIEGKMELSHEPTPGYRTIFFITFTVSVLYLGFILFKTL